MNNRCYLGLTFSKASHLRVPFPRVGLGVKIYKILEYFFFALIFSFMDSFVFKQEVLFRVDFLSVTLYHRVQCPRVGLGVKI